MKSLPCIGCFAGLLMITGCASYSPLLTTTAVFYALEPPPNAVEQGRYYSVAAERSSPTWGAMDYTFAAAEVEGAPIESSTPDKSSTIRFSDAEQQRFLLTIQRRDSKLDRGLMLSLTRGSMKYSFEGQHGEGTLDTLDLGPFVTFPLHKNLLFWDVLVTFGTGRADFALLDKTDLRGADGDAGSVQRFRIGTSLCYRPISWAEIGCGVSAETFAFGGLFGFSEGAAEPFRGLWGGDNTTFSYTPHVFIRIKW